MLCLSRFRERRTEDPRSGAPQCVAANRDPACAERLAQFGYPGGVEFVVEPQLSSREDAPVEQNLRLEVPDLPIEGLQAQFRLGNQLAQLSRAVAPNVDLQLSKLGLLELGEATAELVSRNL